MPLASFVRTIHSQSNASLTTDVLAGNATGRGIPGLSRFWNDLLAAFGVTLNRPLRQAGFRGGVGAETVGRLVVAKLATTIRMLIAVKFAVPRLRIHFLI